MDFFSILTAEADHSPLKKKTEISHKNRLA